MRVEERSISPMAMRPSASTTSNPVSDSHLFSGLGWRLTRTESLTFRNDEWLPSIPLSPQFAHSRWQAESCSLVVYNILYDHHHDTSMTQIKANPTRYCHQQNHLLRTVEVGQPADIYILSEVTPSYLASLKSCKWVRSKYSMVGHEPILSGEQHFGSVVLSRIPVVRSCLFHMESFRPRPLVVVELANGMVLLSCHLKATSPVDPHRSFSIRQAQVSEMSKFLFPSLSRFSATLTPLLVGDTNFEGNTLSDWLRDTHGWTDAWTALYPSEPGFTFDSLRNPFITDLYPSCSERKRPDRVILSNRGRYEVTEMKLFGTEPISSKRPSLRASDHFGILSTFRLKPEEPPLPSIPSQMSSRRQRPHRRRRRSAQPPTETDQSQCSVVVRNIPSDWEDEDLLRLFEEFGKIESVRVMRDRKSGRSRGFGFVNFVSPESPPLAISGRNGHYHGKGRKKNLQVLSYRNKKSESSVVRRKPKSGEGVEKKRRSGVSTTQSQRPSPQRIPSPETRPPVVTMPETYPIWPCVIFGVTCILVVILGAGFIS